LTDPVARVIFARCCDLFNAGENPAIDRLLLEFDDPGLKSLLVELDEQGQDRGGSDLVKQLPDVLASLTRRRESADLLAQTAALKEKQFDGDEEITVLADLVEKLARKSGTE